MANVVREIIVLGVGGVPKWIQLQNMATVSIFRVPRFLTKTRILESVTGTFQGRGRSNYASTFSYVADSTQFDGKFNEY